MDSSHSQVHLKSVPMLLQALGVALSTSAQKLTLLILAMPPEAVIHPSLLQLSAWHEADREGNICICTAHTDYAQADAGSRKGSLLASARRLQKD